MHYTTSVVLFMMNLTLTRRTKKQSIRSSLVCRLPTGFFVDTLAVASMSEGPVLRQATGRSLPFAIPSAARSHVGHIPSHPSGSHFITSDVSLCSLKFVSDFVHSSSSSFLGPLRCLSSPSPCERLCVCVCACACAGACVRPCVRPCVRACVRVCYMNLYDCAVVPVGSTSRGGDVTVYVFNMNQPSLPTPFILFLRLFLCYGPFNCISFHEFSQQFSAFSLCSPNLISALLVLSTAYMSLLTSPKPLPSFSCVSCG